MEYSYKTRGTCSRRINFELDGNIVHNVSFWGGCNGNLQGIARLVEGMSIEDVIMKLENIKCDNKATSCPDQLAQALKQVKHDQKTK